MLVPTMTHEELTKEIMQDFTSIKNIWLSAFAEEYDKERKSNDIYDYEQYPIFKEITTSTNNKWIVLLNKMASSPRYKGLRDLSIVYMCYMSTNNGIRYFKVMPSGGLAIYNQHFFYRYNQRMMLNLNNHLDIVKDYISNNGYSIYKALENQYLKDNDYEEVEMIGISKDGFNIGILIKKYNWVINRTFIRKDQAYINQEEDEKEIISSIKKRIEKYISTNESDLEILKLKDVLAGLIPNN